MLADVQCLDQWTSSTPVVMAAWVKISGSLAGTMKNNSVNVKLFQSFIFVIIFYCLHLNPLLFPRPFGKVIAMESLENLALEVNIWDFIVQALGFWRGQDLRFRVDDGRTFQI